MILYVIDGSKNVISLKGWLEASDDTALRIAADREAYSTIEAVGDCANLVREFDIIKIESNHGIFWGGVTESELTKKGQKTVKITFGMWLDFINLDVDKITAEDIGFNGNVNQIITAWMNQMFKYNITDNGWTSPLRRFYGDQNIKGIFWFQDNQLPFAQAFRQLYKQGICPLFRIEGNNIMIDLDYEKLQEISINMEDTLDYSVSLKNDVFNCVLPLIELKDGTKSFIAKRFLTPEGNVITNVTDISQIITPIKSVIETFSYDTYSSINYAEIDNFLTSQSYANNAVIKINKDYFFYDIFDSNIFRNIGREVRLYLNEYDINLRSVINEIEVKNDVITFTLGLSNTRLFDRIRRK
ncbi:MAG: hypothetical protein ACK5LC_06495 [Coprobacillaceae bacterium]